MMSQQVRTRQIVLMVFWTLIFAGLGIVFSTIALLYVGALPSSLLGSNDEFSTGANVAYALISLKTSQTLWIIVGISLTIGIVGTLTQVLPGTDAESLQKYVTPPPAFAIEGEPYYCLNCGTLVEDEFCGHCGQQKYRHDVTLREFTSHTLPEIINIDLKFFRTVWQLITKPGFLTLEYLYFRRVPHSPPTQLYAVVATVFFFISTNLEFNIEALVNQIPYFSAKVAAAAKEENVPTKVIFERLGDTLETYIPFYTLIMVVAFAGVLRLLYPSWKYVKHLILSLHFVAAFLILWLILIVFSLAFPVLQKIDFIVLVPSLWYLAQALRVVQVGSPVWKIAVAGVVFVLLFFIYSGISSVIGVMLL